MSHRAPQSRAFTITELLVVMSIIILLLALVLPGLTGARRTAKNTVSRSNMRQLHVGLTVFADQNKERFMSPNTEREYDDLTLGLIKSKAWIEASAENMEPDPEGVNDQDYRETDAALEEGWAFEYCGRGAFVSPLDASGRVRSYSMNGFISEVPDPFYLRTIAPYLPIDQGGLPQPPAATLAMIRHPDRMMHLIPEDYQGNPAEGWYTSHNLHGFLMDIVNPVWVDIPAFFTTEGVNIAYMDGRVEYHQFHDTALYRTLRENMTVFDGPDWEFFAGIMMPGLERRMGIPQDP